MPRRNDNLCFFFFKGSYRKHQMKLIIWFFLVLSVYDNGQKIVAEMKKKNVITHNPTQVYFSVHIICIYAHKT